MVTCMLGFCVVSSLGLGPILQTLQAECFASHVRALGGALTGVTGTLTTFLSLKQFQVREILKNLKAQAKSLVFLRR
jgi:hypothetical protein